MDRKEAVKVLEQALEIVRTNNYGQKLEEAKIFMNSLYGKMSINTDYIEPKYYAKIKGWEKKSTNDIYWGKYIGKLDTWWKKDSGGVHLTYTKSEWNELGITSENADFEEVEKEKPKYYAKIKGWELVAGNKKYWNYTRLDKHLFPDTKLEYGTVETIFTKLAWNRLGINDTNADFEEVEE